MLRKFPDDVFSVSAKCTNYNREHVFNCRLTFGQRH